MLQNSHKEDAVMNVDKATLKLHKGNCELLTMG